MNSIKEPLTALGAIAALALLLSVFAFMFDDGQRQPYASDEESTFGPMNPPPRPEFSTSTRERISQSPGFQALVSYTDFGFEPSEVRIQRGETVRFTNNSSLGMWISAVGTDEHPAYPKTTTACGQSGFDSCRVIERSDFWEFTFSEQGSWEYQNTRTEDRGTIIVQ